jgi:hypothetical protein
MMARGDAGLAATRLARSISRAVSWKLDPRLLRATRGRLATALVFPTDRVVPAFASYRRDAAKVNRTIPIVQLTPR